MKLLAVFTILICAVSIMFQAEARKKVLVIGAGMAGISAARALTDAGYDVVILEANPSRYGGRIWTNANALPNVEGSEADLGASWIHGASTQNPLVKLQQKYGLQTFETDYDNTAVYNDVGEAYTDQEILTSWLEFEDIQESLYTKSYSDSSVDVGLETTLITEGHSNWLAHPLSSLWISYEIESNYAAPLNNISSKMYAYEGEDEEDFGDKDVVWTSGYASLLDKLVGGNDNQIKLNIATGEEVNNISINQDTKIVSIATKSGDEYTADSVVITVSLGVLKAGVIQFEPPLPANKRAAIEKIGFGLLNKLVIEFDKAFWPTDVQFFAMTNTDPADRGMLMEWVNFYKIINRPVLLGFASGQAAVDFEKLGDDDMKTLGLSVLKKMFGDAAVDGASVVAWFGTRWGLDPFVFGSYSFPAVGNTIDDWNELERSICPYLYFAGEHTVYDHHGSVHAAYISGQRVADQIMRNGNCDISLGVRTVFSIGFMIICILVLVILGIV